MFDEMVANWSFKIPAGTEIQPGDTMTVKVPEVLGFQNVIKFDISDGLGHMVGKQLLILRLEKWSLLSQTLWQMLRRLILVVVLIFPCIGIERKLSMIRIRQLTGEQLGIDS